MATANVNAYSTAHARGAEFIKTLKMPKFCQDLSGHSRILPQRKNKMADILKARRGLLKRTLIRHVAIGAFLATAAGAFWWFSVVVPRVKRYEDFYANYDAEAVAASLTPSWEEKKEEE